MNTAAEIDSLPLEENWTPSKGVVGMVCLIIAESAIFTIFVVAYVFYIGKSLTGPTPGQVLHLPVWPTICLLSSSITVRLAAKALAASRMSIFQIFIAATILLGGEFLRQTGLEWRQSSSGKVVPSSIAPPSSPCASGP